MAETVRMSLHVDPDIPDMLTELAGGKWKMGQYLSDLIRQVHTSQVEVGQPGEVEALSNAVRHLSLKVKEHDARIAQLEHRQP
jgi:hypothetical protein